MATRAPRGLDNSSDGANQAAIGTCVRLFLHLWSTPVLVPDHLPHRSAHEESVAATVDRYSTKWSVGRPIKKSNVR